MGHSIDDARKLAQRPVPVDTLVATRLTPARRYRACLAAGVQPITMEFTGTIEEAVALAVSENVRRRHLDTGQLALFTVEHLLPQFEAEARERERAGKKHPQFPGTEGPSEAAAAAGKVTGVSASSVKRAKLIKTHGTPAEVDAVRTGKTKLKTAAAHVQARRTSPAKATIKTTKSAPISTVDPKGDPNDEAVHVARQQLVRVLELARSVLAAEPAAPVIDTRLDAILEGFRTVYAWDHRQSFVRILNAHIRHAKKITRKAWHTPASS